MSLRRALPVLALLALAAALTIPGAAEAQCAMCRTALDSPEGRKLIAAFRSGILFLLAVPFATFGTVAWLAVRSKRRLDATQHESIAEGTTPHDEGRDRD
jgi:hypothetical protein